MKKKLKILLINGVNLDMLGKRNPEIYGTFTLKQQNRHICSYAKAKGAVMDCYFSPIEGKLAQKVTHNKADAVIINAGAYSHYSIALRDAIECCGKPVVEVHLSDITNREDFRKIRIFDGVVEACFFGKGIKSYEQAVDYLLSQAQTETQDY